MTGAPALRSLIYLTFGKQARASSAPIVCENYPKRENIAQDCFYRRIRRAIQQ